jgi:competence protein ComEC
LPYHTLIIGRPNLYLVYLYYGFLALFVILINKSPKRINLLVLSFLLIIFIPQDDHKLQFTFLDVGQGDGIVVETPEEKVYLIDGGSSTVKQVGTYRLIPYLKFNGIGQIDAIIVTHGDEDHTSGISEIIEDGSIHIKRLVVPAVPLVESDLVELVDLAQKNKIDVVYIKKGDTIIDDKVNITCLHPDKSFRTASVNAYSTVLEFSYGSFQGLFVGDLEGDGEEGLNHLIHYDLLKVAHHGSKNSTSNGFLLKTQPKISVISCAKKNRYGHPHQELLERLDTAGSKIVITSNCGAITVKTDGKTIGVSTYR